MSRENATDFIAAWQVSTTPPTSTIPAAWA